MTYGRSDQSDDSEGERVGQLTRTKKNDQRAGSPAGHRVAATMVGSGEEVSEIRGRHIRW
jgi:hypothetical protein